MTGKRGVNGLAAGFNVNFFGATFSDDETVSVVDPELGVC